MSREEEGEVVSGRGFQKTTGASSAELDAYRLEIYAADGILLGVIPVKHRAHGIRIFGDNLLIWERNDSVYYRYKIMEKN